MKGVATSTDGVPIAYETGGDRDPALVLVHGWSCDRSYWRGQVDEFSPRHQVVTVDLAGHGESGVARGAWTMIALGDDVVAVIERLELERIVLVGHSMGGDVIVEAAIRAPQPVVGLVWVDVYSTLGDPTTRADLDHFVAPFRTDFSRTTRDFVGGCFAAGADSAVAEWVASDMAAAPPEVALPASEHARGNDGPIFARLPLLTAPLVAIKPGLGDDGRRRAPRPRDRDRDDVRRRTLLDARGSDRLQSSARRDDRPVPRLGAPADAVQGAA
jgi:pimeloyl-ACP methyl ester carboxylesterase